MTLVLTELSRYGIAMVADSAVTLPLRLPRTEDEGRRVLFGATKLRPIPKLNAGISCWGLGEIGGVDTDVWLLDFIHGNESYYDNLEEFALLLQEELRENVPKSIYPRRLRYGTLGFHLAGYVNHEGDMLPTFWHIHNGQSEYLPYIDPQIVNANNDLPPEIAIASIQQATDAGREQWPITRNGDFQRVYSPFIQVMEQLCNYLRDMRNVTIPARSLKGRSEFLAFQVRTIRDLYGLSENLLPSIGGDITVLTITDHGIQSYFNPYDTTL